VHIGQAVDGGARAGRHVGLDVGPWLVAAVGVITLAFFDIKLAVERLFARSKTAADSV